MTGDYTGCELIANERSRQIHDENWTPAHDDRHRGGELAQAAAAYAYPEHLPTREGRRVHKRLLWPWADGWRDHSREERIRELSKAGALIAAEIDRLQRNARREAP